MYTNSQLWFVRGAEDQLGGFDTEDDAIADYQEWTGGSTPMDDGRIVYQRKSVGTDGWQEDGRL